MAEHLLRPVEAEDAVTIYSGSTDPLDVSFRQFRQDIIDDTLPAAAYQRRLVIGLHRGELAAARELVRSHKGLIAAVAYHFIRFDSSNELLIKGAQGLLAAAKSFDQNAQVDFSDHAISTMYDALAAAYPQASGLRYDQDDRPLESLIQLVMDVKEVKGSGPPHEMRKVSLLPLQRTVVSIANGNRANSPQATEITQKPHRRKRIKYDHEEPIPDERITIFHTPTSTEREYDEAAESLYNDHATAIYNHALPILEDPFEVEDVVQETFIKLFRAIRRGKFENYGESSLRAFSIAIAHNLCMDRKRKKIPMPSGLIGLEKPSHDLIEEQVVSGQLLDMIQEELKGTAQFAPLFARIALGLSPVDIAQKLGLTESSVNGLINRGRKSARQLLESMQMQPSFYRHARDDALDESWE